jgi:hypothetical protein
MSRSSWWSLSFWLSHQNPICSFVLIRATYPVHHILLDLIVLIIFGEEYTLWSSSLCSSLQPPVTSSLFAPNILLYTLFPNTFSLCSSLKVRDQVSDPYKTTVVELLSLTLRGEHRRHTVSVQTDWRRQKGFDTMTNRLIVSHNVTWTFTRI